MSCRLVLCCAWGVINLGMVEIPRNFVRRTKSSMFLWSNIGKIYYILAMDKDTQFFGHSLAFLDAVELAGRAAELNRPALVVGERGTGKELIDRKSVV